MGDRIYALLSECGFAGGNLRCRITYPELAAAVDYATSGAPVWIL